MNKAQISGEHPDTITVGTNKSKAKKYICVDVPSAKAGQTT